MSYCNFKMVVFAVKFSDPLTGLVRSLVNYVTVITTQLTRVLARLNGRGISLCGDVV